MSLPQIEVKKILYATDLSENARLAFAYAVSLAARYQAGLTILHVIAEDRELDKRVAGYINEDQWQEIRQRHYQEARQALIGKQREGTAIREVLDRFCADVQADLGGSPFKTDEVLIERGDAAERILQVSADRSIDLIVMGSHGYGAFKDVVMGGTARKVLRRAKMPVLLVRLPEDD